MEDARIKRLVTGGLMAAITCVATMLVRIPVPATHGYVNLGDGMLMLAALLFGPQVGFAAGAIGSALADVFGGYAIYAPATFVIKGAEGLVVALMACKGFGEKPVSLKTFAGLALGGAVMVAGYGLYESVVFGVPAALASVPANCGQAVVGIVVAVVSGTALRRAVKK